MRYLLIGYINRTLYINYIDCQLIAYPPHAGAARRRAFTGVQPLTVALKGAAAVVKY